MKQRLLVSSILVGLYASLSVGNVLAQSTNDPATDPSKKDTQKLESVTVTGSLIPQTQIETASPTLTITADQMKKQGFGNVYDALRAQPLATGSVQDGQFQGGFTQGANALSLLGLDPSFTLTLIDGHPLADYPLQYNGQSNFVDLSNIPTGMIDHVDILPGNQSSIYGSSAIAGVINIVLKHKLEGIELNYRGGGYDQGGGANQRLELLGGHSFDNHIDIIYGVQVSKQNPIWGFQRDDLASTSANSDPNRRYGSRTFLHSFVDANGATQYLDPGASTCSGLSSLFGNTTDYEYRPGRGFYCGSKNETGYGTIQSGTRSAAGYLHATDRINDGVELYATVLYSVDKLRYSDGRRSWTPNGTNGSFFNGNTGQIEGFQHIFSPEESGGLDVGINHELKQAYNVYGGMRGSLFGSSSWAYDAYYDRSQYKDDTRELWPLQAKVDSFFEQQFLGPSQGTQSGYPVYAPNVNNFYKALSPAQYMSFQGLIESQSESWTQHLNLQITNTELFTLPAGAVGIAGVLQAGDQSWSNPAQQALIDGDFYGRTGTAGAGTRSNFAFGGEIRIPVLSMLTADASARYDHFSNDGGGSDGKTTYKLGLEFRPLDSLLFRGSYATAFRAPDMAYSFGGKSGAFGATPDYYRCAVVQPGVAISDCDYNSSQFFSVHQGNPNLHSITAKSFGGGVVWSPTSDLTFKTDYYNVKLGNEVQLQSVDILLKEEAACRLGQLDINSPTCVAALNQVKRNAANAPVPYLLNEVDVFPINIANERVSGLLLASNYRVKTDRFGDFNFALNYNVTLKHEFQQSPNDPTINYLRSPFYSTEFKTILNGSANWSKDNWSVSVLATRYGKTANYAAQQTTQGYDVPKGGSVAPWTLYNGSVGYNFGDNASLTFIVNNIFNAGPPKDPTNTTPPPPFYNIFNYNSLGRQYWLEFDFRFGSSVK
jgi:outer membrane receptor protein involved in Fe transport